METGQPVGFAGCDGSALGNDLSRSAISYDLVVARDRRFRLGL